MGVSADYGGDFSIEKSAERDLFTRGLAVRIHNNVRGLFAYLRYYCFDRAKRVLQNRLHKRARLDIDDANFPLGRLQHDRTAAWCALGIIQRAQQARLQVEESDNVLLIPNMVTGRDNRHACPQKLNCNFSGYPSTAGGVLAVDDNEIQCVLFLQLGQSRDHGVASGRANDIAQKKNR